MGKFYEINTTQDAKGKVADIIWIQKQIEATFRVMKTDIDLRPHLSQNRSDLHGASAAWIISLPDS